MIIAGFLTDGPAIKQQDKLRIGDWIRSIDGHQVRSHAPRSCSQSHTCPQVTLDNIGSVLARYSSSCKVKLTVQRAALLPTLVNINLT